jgi:hypothetical protein
METGLIVYLVFAFGIIPIVLVLSNWRKIVNPVIKLGYEIAIVFRKKEYLPPKIFIEGYGIKRGLNPIEAALISERPFNEVLGMMLVNVLDKGAITILSVEPLKVKVEKLLPDVLNRDERDFVRICVENNVKKRQEKFENLIVKMIKTMSNKMKGFSHLETVNSYFVVVDLATERARREYIQYLVYKLVNDMDEFTRKITKATNPFKDAPIFEEEPEYMKVKPGSGHGGGGYRGGGGGCACACAGCACACAGCACACAGGGR